ncbi:MAG TPA: YdeI/OmpD-associated family protein [Aggregatilineales bacterium]|nr:YdeI/OmpD-associated family protein [Aggregatilineales bacterium]
MKQIFTTTIKIDGNNTGIEVPPEVIAALGSSKKPPVVISVAGYTYRNTVAVMDGRYMVSLSKANREAAGVRGGQTVEVTIELDEAPRSVEVPEDLAAALDAKAGAKAAFDVLAFSKRKEFVRQVEDAKSPETRARRIAGIVAKL